MGHLCRERIAHYRDPDPHAPAQPLFDPTIYFAGVAFDIATGQYGHVTPTRTLILQ